MLAAWQESLRGKKKRKDVAVFSARFADNILLLHRELAEKIYKHGAYHAFKINDPKPRDIHKANVRDRLLHHAIYRILYPHFDKKFIFNSYSCRLEKGTHRAMNKFKECHRIVSQNNTRTAWVLKCDIKKFFASIDHEILLDILKKYIFDKNIIWLLEKIIESFCTNLKPLLTPVVEEYFTTGQAFSWLSAWRLQPGGKGEESRGLPLGNLTSQLLVNIYMNEFDQFIKRELRVACYIRYADDFVILHESKQYLESILLKIRVFLKRRLKLSLHPNKVSIKTLASGVDFLGWVHFSHHRILRTSTRRRMFRNLRNNKSEEVLASYIGMLSHGDTYKTKQEISKF